MLQIVLIWIHVLAAMVWIGGMAFLSLVLVPALRRVDNPALRIDFLKLVGRRFRVVAWGSILILIATGMANLALIGQWPSFQTAFGRLLVIKLLAVGLMLAVTAFHDVIASPRLRSSVGMVKWLPRAGLVLGLVVVLCAVSLSRA
jgi:putative copper export protein